MAKRLSLRSLKYLPRRFSLAVNFDSARSASHGRGTRLSAPSDAHGDFVRPIFNCGFEAPFAKLFPFSLYFYIYLYLSLFLSRARESVSSNRRKIRRRIRRRRVPAQSPREFDSRESTRREIKRGSSLRSLCRSERIDSRDDPRTVNLVPPRVKQGRNYARD